MGDFHDQESVEDVSDRDCRSIRGSELVQKPVVARPDKDHDFMHIGTSRDQQTMRS